MSFVESEVTVPESNVRRDEAPPAHTYGARVVRNLGAGAASYAITIIVQLASVPIFLKYWGTELYGEWLLLLAVPAYFAMSDVGFGNVAATEMTMLVAAGDRRQALKVFQSTWLLITVVSLVLFLLAAAVVPIIDVGYLFKVFHLKATHFKIIHISSADVVRVVLLLTAYVLFGQQTLLLGAGYRCEGRNTLGMMWSNVARFVEFAVLAMGVVAGASVVGAAWIMLLVRMMATLVMRFDLRRLAPWIVFGHRHASLEMVRRLAGPAISFMAVPLGFALRNQGVLIVIGVTLGQVAVVSFSTTRTLTNMAFQVMSIVHLAVWPEISAAFGAKDTETARKLHRKACHVAFWMSSAAVIGLLCCGQWGYTIWTRGKVPFDFYLFATLLLVIVVNSLWYASSAVPMATNTHQRTAIFFLLGTCIAVILAWLLTQSFGVVGAAISLLAIDALMLVTVVPHSLRLVGDTWGAYVRAVLSLPRLDMLQAAFRVFVPRSAAKEASCE